MKRIGTKKLPIIGYRLSINTIQMNDFYPTKDEAEVAKLSNIGSRRRIGQPFQTVRLVPVREDRPMKASDKTNVGAYTQKVRA